MCIDMSEQWTHSALIQTLMCFTVCTIDPHTREHTHWVIMQCDIMSSTEWKCVRHQQYSVTLCCSIKSCSPNHRVCAVEQQEERCRCSLDMSIHRFICQRIIQNGIFSIPFFYCHVKGEKSGKELVTAIVTFSYCAVIMWLLKKTWSTGLTDVLPLLM